MGIYRCSDCEHHVDNDYFPGEPVEDNELCCPLCHEKREEDNEEPDIVVGE